MDFKTAPFKNTHRCLISMGLLWAAGMLWGCMPSLPDGDNLTIIYGSEFPSRMEDVFRADQKENVEITPADWKKRSLIQRSAEILGSMFDYWL